MGMQLFGGLTTPEGQRAAMLAVDRDVPDEYMIHVWGTQPSDRAAALLVVTERDAARLTLRPRELFNIAHNGTLESRAIDDDESRSWFGTLRVHLSGQGTDLSGDWSGPNGQRGSCRFGEPVPTEPVVAPTTCDSWTAFKGWADEVRRDNDVYMFRGHGSKEFALKTTLARHGRHRLQRFLSTTFPAFHGQAEAVLGQRFNIQSDGSDFSVLLGLAQHHGLPTPLLDWTLSPYIAAFFAFSDALDHRSFRPNATHVRVFGLTRGFVQRNSPSVVPISNVEPYAYCLAVPPRHNPRLLAQQGQFLVTNVCHLEAWLVQYSTVNGGPPVLSAADVPIDCAREALDDLKYMGLTAATLLHGLDGVCKTLRHEMMFTSMGVPVPGLAAPVLPPLPESGAPPHEGSE